MSRTQGSAWSCTGSTTHLSPPYWPCETLFAKGPITLSQYMLCASQNRTMLPIVSGCSCCTSHALEEEEERKRERGRERGRTGGGGGAQQPSQAKFFSGSHMEACQTILLPPFAWDLVCSGFLPNLLAPGWLGWWVRYCVTYIIDWGWGCIHLV